MYLSWWFFQGFRVRYNKFYLSVNNWIQSAGADFVMAGGMFAGHDQSGGELIEKDGKKYKLFYGMSSSTAMEVSL